MKKLKDQNGDKLELQQAVRELKHRKKLLEGKVGETWELHFKVVLYKRSSLSTYIVLSVYTVSNLEFCHFVGNCIGF